jgi:hypothetical protein
VARRGGWAMGGSGQWSGDGGGEAQSGDSGSTKTKTKGAAHTVGRVGKFKAPGTKPYLRRLSPVYSSVNRRIY